MIKRYSNFSLKNLNTFGVDVKALNYVRLNSLEDLNKYIQEGIPENHLIIGEGSNLLFLDDYCYSS